MISRSLTTILLISLFSLALISCGGPKNNKKMKGGWKSITVKPQVITTPLYFSGTINPLNTRNIVSPIEGTARKEYFSYGSEVEKGQKLVTIMSSKLQQEFADSLSSYLKADRDYKTKVRKYEASKELSRLKYIAKNEYLQDLSAKKDSYLALLQAEYKIISAAKKLGIYDRLLKIKKVTPEMTKKFLLQAQDTVDIYAPIAGIALFPTSEGGNSAGGGDSKPITEGSQIKSGQVILAIGDLTGFKVFVKVNEVNINQIKVGQAADITGPAFSNITLKGHVTKVDAQAQGNGSSLPQFPITVEIPHITPHQRQTIHVGMSAKVAIKLQTPSVIMLPIAAVFQKNGASMVKVKSKDGTIRDVSVITGQTTLDSVMIKQGLKPGDIVVYHH